MKQSETQIFKSIFYVHGTLGELHHFIEILKKIGWNAIGYPNIEAKNNLLITSEASGFWICNESNNNILKYNLSNSDEWFKAIDHANNIYKLPLFVKVFAEEDPESIFKVTGRTYYPTGFEVIINVNGDTNIVPEEYCQVSSDTEFETKKNEVISKSMGFRKGNQIIAEFNGSIYGFKKTTHQILYSHPLRPEQFFTKAKFHCSWDWIMPACKKWDGLNLDLTEYVDLSDKLDHLAGCYEILPLWDQLLKNIIWYNEHLKHNDSRSTKIV